MLETELNEYDKNYLPNVFTTDLFHIVISLADYASMEVRIVTCKHAWGNCMRGRIGAGIFNIFHAKSIFKWNNFMIPSALDCSIILKYVFINKTNTVACVRNKYQQQKHIY